MQESKIDANILISIVTVIFNAVETIEETILSVINQLGDKAEFIIVDGGSTDGTLGIIEKFSSNISAFISEPDKGIYDAMNKSISLCKGQYIYFIGADDVLMDNVIENVIPNLIGKQVVYGNVHFKFRDKIYDGHFGALKLATRNISHQAIFYPKEVFSHYKFNTDYKIFADYDLNLKLYRDKNFPFKYIPITIALFNDTGSSGSNSPDLKFERDRNSIIKKNYPYWIYLYRITRTRFAKLFVKYE